jgi:hypothetical protein
LCRHLGRFWRNGILSGRLWGALSVSKRQLQDCTFGSRDGRR